MKKKIIISLITILGVIKITAQIGIYTQNPQAAFHIDGAKDNVSVGVPTAGQQANDVAVTSNGSVGIGTSTPDASAALEIRSVNQGMLPPRVTLISETDNLTITNPATGLTVFHLGTTGSNAMEAGLYSNVGTPASPKWSKGTQNNNTTEGSKIYKSVYRGRNESPYTKPNLVVPEMNLMFRFAVVDNVMRFQVRMIDPPTQAVTWVRLLGHWQGVDEPHHYSYAVSLSFNSSNYSTWTNFAGNWSDEWGYYYLIYTDEVRTGANNPYDHAMNLYGIDSYGYYGSLTNDINRELYSLAAEVF